jgi:MarR family transcriptional regulator, temperature-dependent positive regulator of motility
MPRGNHAARHRCIAPSTVDLFDGTRLIGSFPVEGSARERRRTRIKAGVNNTHAYYSVNVDVVAIGSGANGSYVSLNQRNWSALMKDNHRSGPLDTSALHLLHRAGQCAEVLFTNETSKSDLTPRQYAVLVCVGQNPDVSQTGLVEQTGVDRSTLADVVRRLVKKGLLQRKRTKRDARMYAVRLTAKGQNILNSVKPHATKVDQRILAVLRSDQRGTFVDALGDIVRAMSRATVQGRAA